MSVGCADMASQSMALDDPVSFRSLMADCHMPSIQIEHIFNAGYTTIALLAHGIHDESKMEEFVEHLSVIPDGETFQTFSPQSAAIRRVLKECIAKCVLSGRDAPIDAPTAPTTKTRLSVADVKALKTEFCQNYPGELLLPGTMPSLSFLCILKDAIDTNNFTWIPWKSRTSEADEQAFAEHRRPRNDRQLLRSLLTEGDSVLNEQPEAVINHQAPTEVVLAKFQNLLSVALAMLGSAHLLVLKRFHAKFLELALAKPRDQHLRAPSLSEILDADRVAWSAVTDLLYESKWTLNDVLNEVAFCRQVFHTSLAPRPCPVQQPKQDPPKRRPDLPKPLPKKPKTVSPGNDSPKQPKSDTKDLKWDNSWLRKLPDGKGICMRFNLNKCKSGKTCRFAHQCPVPKANGEPCGGFHTAARHKSAPH